MREQPEISAVEHKRVVMQIDSLTDEEALSEYSIRYYTVQDIIQGGELGTKIHKLYKDNYL